MPQWDLKYRPSNFSDVIGNQGVIKLLRKRSQNGTLGDQSMMLSGQRGCGKTTLARIISKALSCTFLQEGEPCNECPSCLSITQDNSQSFEELDAASQGTIDRIREMINDSNYATMDGAKQVYIIDEAQRLSAAAQEAFLKAIESRLFIVILCTTDPQKVKVPIRSRLEEYPIYPPTDIELKNRLITICKAESVEYEDAGINLLMKVKENCPRECIIALDTMSQLGTITDTIVRSFFRFDSYELVSNLLSQLDVSPKTAMEMLDELQNRESPTWIKDSIIAAISSAVRVGVGGKATYPVPTAFFERRGKGWFDTALDLGRVDRINMSDITAILLKDSSVVPVFTSPPVYVTQEAPAPVKPETPREAPVAKEEVKSKPPETKKAEAKPERKDTKSPVVKNTRPVTVEGVSFNREERLTSFDDRVKSRETKEESPAALLQVELSADHAPVSEKEFKEKVISRFKST